MPGGQGTGSKAGADSPATMLLLSLLGPALPVAASARLHGVLRVLVIVLRGSSCEASGPPSVRAACWVPAHAPGGRLSVWFDPRAC